RGREGQPQGRRRQGEGRVPQVARAAGRRSRRPTARHPSRKDTIMGFLSFLLLGLIAGAIAKLIIPGEQRGGWFITLLLGVIGAMLGGWLGGLIFDVGLESFFSLSTWLLAIGGSLIVLLIYGLIVGRRSDAR